MYEFFEAIDLHREYSVLVYNTYRSNLFPKYVQQGTDCVGL
jgi:hypothetical protein